MNTPTLLPCPFCGGEAALTQGRDYGKYVTCKRDDCRMNDDYACHYNTDDTYAIDRWNKRASAGRTWIPVVEQPAPIEERLYVTLDYGSVADGEISIDSATPMLLCDGGIVEASRIIAWMRWFEPVVAYSPPA